MESSDILPDLDVYYDANLKVQRISSDGIVMSPPSNAPYRSKSVTNMYPIHSLAASVPRPKSSDDGRARDDRRRVPARDVDGLETVHVWRGGERLGPFLKNDAILRSFRGSV
jgi:hypothetical protein